MLFNYFIFHKKKTVIYCVLFTFVVCVCVCVLIYITVNSTKPRFVIESVVLRWGSFVIQASISP